MFNKEQFIEKIEAEIEEFRNSYNDFSIIQTYNDWYIIGFYECLYEAFADHLLENSVSLEAMEWLDSFEKPMRLLYDALMDESFRGISFDNYSTFADLIESAYSVDNPLQATALTIPDDIEQDLPSIIKSFAPGQSFLEIDTEKTIVLNKKVASDIWNFKVYDANHNYLYDTSATETRLAKDIACGYVVSKAEMGKKMGLSEQIQNASEKATNESVVSETKNKEEKLELF